ncbi:DUF2804 domain-containing protein [Chitinimonas viridis]|uniref:DUF2804 domain-containing protein n=1 Tax=Chitinimonas viridis TaxID=664880 RepID=A0ABT8B0I2_9NEIS|nr:DUF2804 domain-containing protein [Chitinimonas viridis]MDN3575732.1 DUF2804 domain-containing protein [Chitinimonas viridis]
MTARFVRDLLAAPVAVPDAVAPLAGQFAGRCGEIDWRALPAGLQRPAWWRLFHHKRWQYMGIACGDCFIGAAVVHVGWTNAAFAYLFDRASGKVLAATSRDGLPGLTARVADVPAAGAESRFAWRGTRVQMLEPTAGQFVLEVDGPDGFSVRAGLDGRAAAPWLFATGPVDGGVWHATHKSPALQVQGEARVGGRVYRLDGGHASLDHSNGLLPRNTRWLWASAHGAEVGFNLQAGYFGNHENVLWLHGQLIALGAAEFSYDQANTLAPWHVRTDDGLLDLHFHPEGERREDRDLIVAASRYVQPVGTYHGWVKASAQAEPYQVAGLLGVAEDHHSRW